MEEQEEFLLVINLKIEISDRNGPKLEIHLPYYVTYDKIQTQINELYHKYFKRYNIGYELQVK